MSYMSHFIHLLLTLLSMDFTIADSASFVFTVDFKQLGSQEFSTLSFRFRKHSRSSAIEASFQTLLLLSLIARESQCELKIQGDQFVDSKTKFEVQQLFFC
jgi:hypothetical protein